MKQLLALMSLCFGVEVAAQELFKCKSATGKITYSSQSCKEIGLSSAGEIKGEVSVQPAFKPPPPTKPSPPRAAVEAPAAANPPEEAAKPARRCFTIKTAKGTATRCNDDPQETEK